MKERTCKKPILDGLKGSHTLSENTIVRHKFHKMFKSLKAKDWREPDKLVSAYLDNEIVWAKTGPEFYSLVKKEFTKLCNVKSESIALVRYTQSVSDFLSKPKMKATIVKIYSQAEQKKRLEEAQTNSNTESQIASHSMIADASRRFSERLQQANNNQAVIQETTDSQSSAVEPDAFLIDSNDTSYVIDSPSLVNEYLVPDEYLLLLFEVNSLNSNKYIVSVEKDVSVEERLQLSGINYKETNMEDTVLHKFSDGFSVALNKMRRCITSKSAPNANEFQLVNKEKNLIIYVGFILDKIIKENKLKPIAAVRIFNIDKNKERDFITKNIYPLIFGVLNDFSVFFYQEVTSNIFIDCNLPIILCEYDFVLIDQFGLELGTCEVKPPGADQRDIDNDICRIAESTKRQLHKRIMQARSEKEVITFGIMFNGYNVSFYTHTMTKTGDYMFTRIGFTTLPTLPSSFSNMEEFLEVFVTFANMIEESLVEYDDMLPVISHLYSSAFKPTLCKLKDF